MNTDQLYHYTYIITNVVENKYYIGCRSCAVRPENDLGVRYFSSSKDTNFIQDQKTNPQNYKYKILARFESRELAIRLEIKLHNIHDVAVNPRFYNKAKQTSIGWDTTGTSLSASHKNTIVTKLKDWMLVPENKDKFISCLKGRIVSEETRKKISIANKGNTPHNKGGTSHMKGKTHTEDTKAKMSAARKGKKPSQNTIEASIKARVKLANIYDYSTNELLAESVCLTSYARENGYDRSCLSATARADKTKPSSTKNKRQHKGIYAQYV